MRLHYAPTTRWGKDKLWVSDFTYVRTGLSLAYVAFVIDAFARRIVGWQVSNSLKSDLALNALELAIAERKADGQCSLVHHSDRGSQYLSIRYTARLALAGTEPSVCSWGDSYDNALAESIIGLQQDLIYPRGPWTRLEDVALATLEYVWWFNHHRLLQPIGDLPPAEFEEQYHSHRTAQLEAVGLKPNGLR